jgi:hypothetical protein
MSGACPLGHFVERTAGLFAGPELVALPSSADVGVTYRVGHGGMVDTSLDRVAAEDVLAGPDGAGVRRHVPDILLADAAGVTVVDVKAPGKRDDPPVRAVMEWTRTVAGLRGWGFEEWHGAARCCWPTCRSWPATAAPR